MEGNRSELTLNNVAELFLPSALPHPTPTPDQTSSLPLTFLESLDTAPRKILLLNHFSVPFSFFFIVLVTSNTHYHIVGRMNRALEQTFF